MPTISAFFLKTFIVTLSLFLVLASPASAQTAEWSGVCVGDPSTSIPGTDLQTNDASDVATIQGVGCLIANIFSVAISFIGFAGIVMLIVGSFRYLLSGGNTKGTESARNTITFAVVGLVVAISAFIILGLLAQFTGVGTIMRFIIPTSDSGLDGEFQIEEPAGPLNPLTAEPPRF